jgi:hypothetical protein
MFQYKVVYTPPEGFAVALHDAMQDGWRLHTLLPVESLIHSGSSGDVYGPDSQVTTKFMLVLERIDPEPEVEEAPQPMECKS